MAELSINSLHQKFQPKITQRLKMNIVAQLMKVEAISVKEIGDDVSENDSSFRIRIEALRRLEALRRKGNKPVSNVIEIDIDSSICFQGLNIVQTAWLENSMCVYFESPTDIAIIDTGDDFDIPYYREEPPLRSIVVTDFENFSPSPHGDN